MNKFSNPFRSEMTEQTNSDVGGVTGGGGARFIFNFTVNLKIYVSHIKKM